MADKLLSAERLAEIDEIISSARGGATNLWAIADLLNHIDAQAALLKSVEGEREILRRSLSAESQKAMFEGIEAHANDLQTKLTAAEHRACVAEALLRRAIEQLGPDGYSPDFGKPWTDLVRATLTKESQP